MDDLIRRQDAIDAICTGSLSAATVYGRTDKGMAALKETVKLIKSLPSVSVTEKTGRWEFVQYDSNPNIENWHCSKCNRIVCGAITAKSPVYSYKYCPNCGARMVEPKESEDKE